MKELLKLTFEATDRHFHIHRLVVFPEAKVYARGVVEEGSTESICLEDCLDMDNLEWKLFKDNYVVKLLKEID